MFALIALAAGADLTVDLATVVGAGAPSLLGGSAAACSGARVPLNRVSEQTEAAERAIAYLDYAAARGALRAARAALVCVEEPIAGNLAARVPFLEGIVEHLTGGPGAKALFQESLVLRPLQAWDPDYPPDAMIVFDAARRAIEDDASVELTIVPAPPADALWVDGQRWSGTGEHVLLRRGPHYLQLADQGWTTLRVDLQAPDTLTVPAWVGGDLDAWVADPKRGAVLGELLERRFDVGTVVELRTPTGRWTGTVGAGVFTVAPAPTLPRRSPLPRATLAVGGVTLAAGVGLLAASLVEMNTAVGLAEQTNEYDAYRIALGRYQTSTALLDVGRWVSAVGAAGVAVGVPLVVFQDVRHRKAIQAVVR
jgi:hypothetical protein